MSSVPDIAICITIICLPTGAAACWLGVRMLKGKSMGYIAGNANDYYDDSESPEQKARGGTFGALAIVVGLLVLACIPLCFLFG